MYCNVILNKFNKIKNVTFLNHFLTDNSEFEQCV